MSLLIFHEHKVTGLGSGSKWSPAVQCIAMVILNVLEDESDPGWVKCRFLEEICSRDFRKVTSRIEFVVSKSYETLTDQIYAWELTWKGLRKVTLISQGIIYGFVLSKYEDRVPRSRNRIQNLVQLYWKYEIFLEGVNLWLAEVIQA